MRFPVTLDRDEDGVWVVECPSIPGCVSQGSTKARALKNIRQAIKLSDATGTRSILDMERISATPESSAVSPLPPVDLQALFGTKHPTREMVEGCEELFERIDRGQGIYVITYKEGKPEGIYFAGYSFD